MSDNTELKRLAEAAPEGPWFGPEYAPGTSYVFDVDLGTLLHYESIDTEQDTCLRYVAAANPAAVLALIAENARLVPFEEAYATACNVRNRLIKENELLDRLVVTNKALSDSFRAERDQLRAEVAGLRTGYEAYEQVNAELKAEVEGLRQFIQGFADYDAEISFAYAALGQGEQS